MRARIDRMLEKLARVRSEGREAFGCEAHGYELSPPLAEEDAAAFERAHQVALPPEYRAFLTEMGNGGAGPYYGVYPLHPWDDVAASSRDEVPPGFLAQTCPLLPGPATRETFDDHPSPYGGTLTIGTRGCSYMTLLVVTGPSRGRVVYVDLDGARPYVTRAPDFLTWYEGWLDELLEDRHDPFYGFGPIGGEPELHAMLDDATLDDDAQLEALHALAKRKPVTDATRDRVARALGDARPTFRRAAAQLVGRLKMKSHADAVRALLDDPDPPLRKLAVTTLGELGAGTDALERALFDADSRVASAAFTELEPDGSGHGGARRAQGGEATAPAWSGPREEVARWRHVHQRNERARIGTLAIHRRSGAQ